MASDLFGAQADLNAARDRLRRSMMGSPLRVSDADLDALATLSDADVAAAEALWRQANPGPLGDLLDAEPTEE